MNRCEADFERRARAKHGGDFVVRVGSMERRIQFLTGFDHTAFPEDCGGGGHGRHGMELAFILIGPAGAVTWSACMQNWYPGNTDAVDSVKAGETYAKDLGYHSPKPLWDGQDEYRRDDCHLLPDGVCYYDGSSLNAGPVLVEFLEHGPHAVWVALARYYQELFGEVAALDE